MGRAVAFIWVALQLPGMQCHYCGSAADITVEKGGVRVGVCEQHFREQMDELADAEFVEDISEELDIDRTE
jgi:hypothetical protein